jgi:hypothetical protein
MNVGALARRAPAWAITATLALLYVIAGPPSTDLAAATYRSDLFARVGFTFWDNGWYGGHHLLAYSVLAPALGALLGPQLLAALSMTIAAALFTALIGGRFPAPATRIAAIWFAAGAAIALLANRVPFDLGLAIGLGALLAARSSISRRSRLALALALAALCALASPVAGAFLALAALAWALAARSHRRAGWLPLSLTFAASAPIALLVLAFPEGGSQPFAPSAFYPALAGVLVIAALIPSEQRTLRIGALLYAAVLIGAYVIPSPVGGNADRLGALAAGPIAACVLAGRPSARTGAPAGALRAGQSSRGVRWPPPARWRPRLLLALAPALIYWQANAPVADFAAAASDPAVHASYYAPLLAELKALGVGYSGRPVRIEAVPIVDHWEARFLAPHVAIARGWERQLDNERNALFYDESTPLTSARYHAWLSQEAVSYVALPDAALDYSAISEARLLEGTLSSAGSGGGERELHQARAGRPAYLREVWRSAHWRLFAVLGASSLAQPPAVLTQLGSDSFVLRLPRAGTFTVRVHFTPYWTLASTHGCVRRAPGDWTQVQVPRGGLARVVVDFSLARMFDHGPRCS